MNYASRNQIDIFNEDNQFILPEKIEGDFPDSPIRIVVPLSGGRDSQSCLKLAVNSVGADRVLALFCDTQFEHPITYQHIEKCGKLYGVKVKTVCAGSVESAIRKYKRFPGGGARHCTESLKIIPSKKFYSEFADINGPFEVWIGIRGDEGHERKARYEGKESGETYTPNEFMSKYPKYLSKKGVIVRLPIINWFIDDIDRFLGNDRNPLYSLGFSRVGCFPCMAAGDATKEKAFYFDDTGIKHLKIAKKLADEFGLDIYRSKVGKAREAYRNKDDGFEGCSICAM